MPDAPLRQPVARAVPPALEARFAPPPHSRASRDVDDRTQQSLDATVGGGPWTRAGASVATAAMAGFLVGAVFWHFIGFWGFVRDVVYRGPAANESEIAQTGARCTAFVLDRAAARSYRAACPAEATALAEGHALARTDFGGGLKPMAARRWSVTVQAEAESAEAESSD